MDTPLQAESQIPKKNLNDNFEIKTASSSEKDLTFKSKKTNTLITFGLSFFRSLMVEIVSTVVVCLTLNYFLR